MRLRGYYASGLLFHFGYYFVAFSFFIAMYPLDFAGLDTAASLAVIFAAMVLLPLFQASFAAFSVLLLGLLEKRRMLSFPTAFSLALASLYTLASHAQNLTWAGIPWGSLAVGLTGAPILIQTASLFGSSFLVFLCVLCGSLTAEALVAFRHCLDRHARIALLLSLSLFLSNLLVGGALLSVTHEDAPTVKVGLIQGCAPSTENTSVDALLRRCRYEALRLSAKEEVDLMLWSESVVPHALEAAPSRRAFLSQVAKDTGVTQVVGAFTSVKDDSGTEKGYYNALFVFYPDGGTDEMTYKKQRPVPFGEYVPMKSLFSALIPALTEISMLSRDTDSGEGSTVFSLSCGQAGALICFDSIYPDLARESVRAGAEYILLSTDDSWFDGSAGKTIHLSHARLRAVENGRYIARTGNTGLSAVIDDKGQLLTLLEADTATHGADTVLRLTHQTLYTRIGDLFLLPLSLYLVFLPIFALARRKNNTKERN